MPLSLSLALSPGEGAGVPRLAFRGRPGRKTKLRDENRVLCSTTRREVHHGRMTGVGATSAST